MTSNAGSATAVDESVSDLAVEQQEQQLRKRAMQDPAVRALIGSRLASVLGIATLTYGAMIYLAAIGAPQIVISLTGATRYLAALLFGIGGGALADAMSKRTAMVTAYILQAAACFIIPTVWGTGVWSLIVLIFVVSMLGQIVTPRSRRRRPGHQCCPSRGCGGDHLRRGRHRLSAGHVYSGPTFDQLRHAAIARLCVRRPCLRRHPRHEGAPEMETASLTQAARTTDGARPSQPCETRPSGCWPTAKLARCSSSDRSWWPSLTG